MGGGMGGSMGGGMGGGMGGEGEGVDALQYKDEDGDLVDLCTDAALEEAVQFAKSGAHTALKGMLLTYFSFIFQSIFSLYSVYVQSMFSLCSV